MKLPERVKREVTAAIANCSNLANKQDWNVSLITVKMFCSVMS